MNHKIMSWLVLFVAMLSLTACASTFQPSMRRYLDRLEIARTMPDLFDLNYELTESRFRLLEQPEVQQELALSQDQYMAVKNAFLATDEIPGHKELFTQLGNTRKLPEAERRLKNQIYRKQYDQLILKYRSHSLSQILTPKQSARLDQLFLQLHGPVLILTQENLTQTLEISLDQLTMIEADITEANHMIVENLQEYGQGFISNLGTEETQESRESDLHELANHICCMIKRRDNSIIKSLTDIQRIKYREMLGKQLNIDWNPMGFLDHPFEK